MSNRIKQAIKALEAMPAERREMILDLILDPDVGPDGVYVMTPEEAAAYDEGIRDIEAGRVVSHEDVQVMLARFRR
jgi:hypothetical protein